MYPPVVFQLATAAPRLKAPARIPEFTGAGMPPAPMNVNEPLTGMESRSWPIRHCAYGQSNKDFMIKLQ